MRSHYIDRGSWAISWGFCAYRHLDFHFALDWSPVTPPREGFIRFRRGIEFGWDWPKAIWFINSFGGMPGTYDSSRWTGREYSFGGICWPRYFTVKR